MRRLWRWWQERRVCAKLAKEWGVHPAFVRALRAGAQGWAMPVFVPRKNVVIMDLKGT